MPIHKRDRNFQNIVSELDIKSIPTEYIQLIGLICENGDRIQFKGDQIKKFPGDDLVEGLINFVRGEDYFNYKGDCQLKKPRKRTKIKTDR